MPPRSVKRPPSAASRIGLVRRIAEPTRPMSKTSLIRRRRPSRAWRASHSRTATIRMITAWITLTSCSGTSVWSCSPVPPVCSAARKKPLTAVSAGLKAASIPAVSPVHAVPGPTTESLT